MLLSSPHHSPETTDLKQQLEPAKLRRDDIRNVDVVDATEEGRPDYHQYEHKSIKEKQNTFILLSRALNSPPSGGLLNNMQAW